MLESGRLGELGRRVELGRGNNLSQSRESGLGHDSIWPGESGQENAGEYRPVKGRPPHMLDPKRVQALWRRMHAVRRHGTPRYTRVCQAQRKRWRRRGIVKDALCMLWFHPMHIRGGRGHAVYAAGPHHESLREGGYHFQGFVPAQSHHFLVEVYSDHLHHNNGMHLDGGIADDAIWKRRWKRLFTQSDSWYIMPTGAVGRMFTA